LGIPDLPGHKQVRFPIVNGWIPVDPAAGGAEVARMEADGSWIYVVTDARSKDVDSPGLPLSATRLLQIAERIPLKP